MREDLRFHLKKFKNNLKVMFPLLIVVLFSILLVSCAEDEVIQVKQHSAVIPESVPIGEGFEGGSFSSGWIRGGSSLWSVTSVEPYNGNYCTRSGLITHNQYSYLEKTLSFTGNKTISFYYRVSSELNSDYLVFYINGVQINQWSGDISWSLFTTNFNGNGKVTLRWEYSKNATGSQGQDRAWIDKISVQ